MYLCQFAPDGVHFTTQKKVKDSEAWYRWLTSLEVVEARCLMPNFKARVVNTETKETYGDK